MPLDDISNIYTPTTYEDMMELRKQSEESKRKFKQSYKDFLITCLCKAGFAKKIVRIKGTDTTGVLEVEENSYSTLRPFEIKFYHTTKSGRLSKIPKYVPSFRSFPDENRVQNLLDAFELAGDENAG